MRLFVDLKISVSLGADATQINRRNQREAGRILANLPDAKADKVPAKNIAIRSKPATAAKAGRHRDYLLKFTDTHFHKKPVDSLSLESQSDNPVPGQIKLPHTLNVLRKATLPRKLGLLEKLYGEWLQRQGIAWVRCWNGTIWKLDLSDPCHRWMVYGIYEGGTGIRLAKRILAKGGVFVDSGANIGQWLTYLGGISGVKALEFEPVISQRLWLKQCLDHQTTWDVQLLDCGLGNEEAELEIQVWGSRSTLRTDWYVTKNFPTEKVLIRRLDQVLPEYHVEVVDFWKLDVEGAELQALEGASALLQRKQIRHIWIECNPSTYKEARHLLERHGYSLYSCHHNKIEPAPAEGITTAQDLLAKPNR